MIKTFFMNKKAILLLVAVMGSLVGFTACMLFSVFTNAFKPTPPPPEFLIDWLQAPVCQPPCWYGITPGTITMTDTAKILDEIPWAKVEFGPEKVMETAPYSQIDWKARKTNNIGGFANSDRKGIMTVSFSIGGDLSIKIEEVVQAFGYPSDVMARDCHAGSCHTELIYLSSGMVLIITPKPDLRGFVKVKPDEDIERIIFFQPGEDGFLDAFPSYSDSYADWVVPWKGYAKYKVIIW